MPRSTAAIWAIRLFAAFLFLGSTIGSAGCNVLCGLNDSCKKDDCTTTSTSPSCVTPTPTPTKVTGSRELSIVPIAQQTERWCWAASAEMILRYYNEPNLNPAGDYQCGVVGGYYYLIGGQFHPCVSNCYLCPQGASSMFEIQRIITGYGQIAQFYGVPAKVLTSLSRAGQLSLEELAGEFNANRPVLAGISFPGQITLPGISGHAVVFSGYDATTNVPTVTVRDPYPYEAFIPANQNPYLVAGGVYLGPGTYRIAYAALSGPRVTWGNTAYRIQ